WWMGGWEQGGWCAIKDGWYDGLTPDEAVTAVVETMGGAAPQGSSYRRQEVLLASDPYPGEKRYSALEKFVRSRDWPELLAGIKTAGLPGMGGAGYPTNQKS